MLAKPAWGPSTLVTTSVPPAHLGVVHRWQGEGGGVLSLVAFRRQDRRQSRHDALAGQGSLPEGCSLHATGL
jgi:hypothetical protein